MKQLLFILMAFFSLNSNAQFIDPQCWSYYDQGRATDSQSIYYAVYEKIEQDTYSDIESGQLSYIHRDSLFHKQSQVIGLQDSLNLKLNKTSISSWAKASTKPTYTWSEILSKPTFASVATSGSYNDLTDKPTIPSNQTLSLLDRTLSISDGNSVTLPSTSIIISNPTRSFNTNFNVLNTTLVFYSIKIENGTALVSATTGTAYLEYSVNGGTSWITVSQVMREENGLSLLNINTKGSTFVLSGIIPGGSLARIRINALAGSSISLLSTQENAF